MQTGNVENPWLSAMSSHFVYWASLDVALFILRALHHQDVRLGASKEPPAAAVAKSPPPAQAADGTGLPDGATPVGDATGLLTPPSGKSASPAWSPRSDGVGTPSAPLPRGLSDPEDWW